jgi:hypothetical protein
MRRMELLINEDLRDFSEETREFLLSLD